MRGIRGVGGFPCCGFILVMEFRLVGRLEIRQCLGCGIRDPTLVVAARACMKQLGSAMTDLPACRQTPPARREGILGATRARPVRPDVGCNNSSTYDRSPWLLRCNLGDRCTRLHIDLAPQSQVAIIFALVGARVWNCGDDGARPYSGPRVCDRSGDHGYLFLRFRAAGSRFLLWGVAAVDGLGWDRLKLLSEGNFPSSTTLVTPNKSMKANRRCNFALIGAQRIGHAFHAQPLLSAAVAYFFR